MPSSEIPAEKPVARSIAAIDIGSNSLRMAIAQVLPDGHIEVLERLQRAVRLGQDTFRRGRLGGQSMRAAIGILRDYKQMLGLYHAERIRAVATSAVREAANADTFLDRVFMATGLNVEVISTSEESRLTVSAVREALGDALGISHEEALIADVGGGSTLLTVLHQGEITTSQSLRLGSIRLQEMLSTSEESPERSAELLRYHIANTVATAQGAAILKGIHVLVAVGGDVRFAARQIGKPTASPELFIVSAADFDELVERCQHYTVEELSKRFGLPFAEAETLNPALLVYQILLRRIGAKEMIVSGVSMRDGLLLELAHEVTGEEDEAILQGVIHSAMALGEKFRVDQDHAQRVAEISMRLFDELKADHGLGPRQCLLLRVAALLHEVGGFVSGQAHHKHSYYLISNSEIFGLSPAEVHLVAHIARYHRRSVPMPSHTDFMSLPREQRVMVTKLAAILRVADALVRGRIRQAGTLQFSRQGDELVIIVPEGGSFVLEERALAIKGDLFEDIYGMKVRLEEG
jgi:exopolyphosphatase/guanosine-5'-triphosphate,3'-diphosphate pyrophosphatase